MSYYFDGEDYSSAADCPAFQEDWPFTPDFDNDTFTGDIVWQWPVFNIQFAKVLMTVHYLFVGLTLMLCFACRNQPWIKQRGKPWFMLTSAIGGLIGTYTICGREIITRNEFSCIQFVVLTNLSTPLVIGPVIARFAIYKNKIFYCRYLSQYMLNRMKPSSPKIFHPSEQRGASFWNCCVAILCGRGAIEVTDTIEVTRYESEDISAIDGNQSDIEMTDVFSSEKSIPQHIRTVSTFSQTDDILTPLGLMLMNVGKGNEQARIKYVRFFTKWPFAVAIVVFMVILAVLLGIVADINRLNPMCTGCFYNADGRYAVLVVGSCLLIWAFYMLYALRHEPDVLGILREFIYVLTVCGIFFIIGMSIYMFDPGNLNATGEFNWDYFVVLGYIGCHYFQCPYQVLQSYLYNKKILARHYSDVDFDMVLNSVSGRSYFEKHLILETSVENLYFWTQARKWKKKFRPSSSTCVNGAKEIYQVFLTAGSNFQLNIPDKIQKAIANDIADSNIYATMFDDAINNAYMLMKRDSFIRFLNSKLYKLWADVNAKA